MHNHEGFYINYVICKLLAPAMTLLLLPRFILTMWYVNSAIAFRIASGSVSFILTMWYVNSIYLDDFTPISSSFILTMWYVNLDELLKNASGFTSFILTMWYVNILEEGNNNITWSVLY